MPKDWNKSCGIRSETRYEINKKIMPYLDIAYEYSKGNEQTSWQDASDSEQGWRYGIGLRMMF